MATNIGGTYNTPKMMDEEGPLAARVAKDIARRSFSMICKGSWSELYTHKPINIYRRNLQKAYVKNMVSLVKPPAGTYQIALKACK